MRVQSTVLIYASCVQVRSNTDQARLRESIDRASRHNLATSFWGVGRPCAALPGAPLLHGSCEAGLRSLFPPKIALRDHSFRFVFLSLVVSAASISFCCSVCEPVARSARSETGRGHSLLRDSCHHLLRNGGAWFRLPNSSHEFCQTPRRCVEAQLPRPGDRSC